MSSLKTVSRTTDRVKQGQGPRSQRPGPFFGPPGGWVLTYAAGPADRGPRPAATRSTATRAASTWSTATRAASTWSTATRAASPRPAATRATGRRAPGRRAGARYPARGPGLKRPRPWSGYGHQGSGRVTGGFKLIERSRSDTDEKKPATWAGSWPGETGQLRPACPRARPARPAWHRPCPRHRPYRW